MGVPSSASVCCSSPRRDWGEALAPREFGEARMLFLPPLEGFPILLVGSGIVRPIRGASEQ